MTQDDLFTVKHARRDDPDTSFIASESVKEMAGRHCAIVLATLKLYPDGLTPHEVSERCVLNYSQAWRRMSDLRNAGLAVEVLQNVDGVVKPLTRLNPSNRQARVLRACRTT